MGSSETLEILVRAANDVAFPQTWPSGKALIDQIADEYRKLYKPEYGSKISSRTSLDLAMTTEQAAFHSYLINPGLGSVKRIIAVAQKLFDVARSHYSVEYPFRRLRIFDVPLLSVGRWRGSASTSVI